MLIVGLYGNRVWGLESCINMQESRGFGILGWMSFDWMKESTEDVSHTTF